MLQDYMLKEPFDAMAILGSGVITIFLCGGSLLVDLEFGIDILRLPSINTGS